jgi:NAD(P)-dependent dehydrogenase (short-subunit alcohol dehydrogenase family)
MKNILITGAENPDGLGAEIVKQLKIKYEGCKILNISKQDIKNELYKEILQRFYVDQQLKDEKKEFDFVINNFGTNHLTSIGTTTSEDKEILIQNVFVPYDIINFLVASGSKPARVLNISSQTYRIAQRKSSLYCASKAALSHMTKVMARELAPDGWVVNALAPGKILGTTMTKLVDEQVESLRGWSSEEANNYAISLIPMQRFTTKEEVAEAALKILEMPAYINGETIAMTGGV